VEHVSWNNVTKFTPRRDDKPSMLRITRCMSADGAERYFDEALKRSDYYAREVGLWGGKGAQRLQLKGEVEREDFVALVRNRVPRSKGQGRLTARDNTTREEWKLDPITGQWGWKEVANRQTGYDWTFSFTFDKCRGFAFGARKSLGLDFPGRTHGQHSFFGEPREQHPDGGHVLFDR